MAILEKRSLLRDAILLLLSVPVGCIDITVEKNNELFESSPLLYGFMFEDINFSGDGGLHGQLLRNNGFQGDNSSLSAYEPIGDVKLSVDTENPLSDAIPNSLAVSVSPGYGDGAGFANTGYWGFPIDNDNYTTGFYMKGDYVGSVSIQLLNAVDDTEYGSVELDINSNSSNYTYFETSLVARAAPDGQNLWALTLVDGSQAAGNTFYFDLVQLYGTTYKNRSNGLKPSLAQPLADVGGSFLRFPGGNNLEGETPDTRWKWNETIGPLMDRPGRMGTWGYPNTDALGLIEYFHWCEDLELTPILGVYGGLSLRGKEADIITGDALVPYVEDVMNELEYLLGSTGTEYGALRESHGYPDPFVVDHVEIGNEDNLSNFGPSYPERFMAFYDAIHEKYPNITIIASNTDYLPDPAPEGIWIDNHTYSAPSELVEFFTMWDDADRSIPVFVGEYACKWRDDGSGMPLPEMQGSVAEAVFLIGIERNSDVVKMAAYAPLLQNIEGTQWEPDLISFSNLDNDVVLSTSYYVQKLFATYRGSTILSSTSDSEFGPIYWVASRSSSNTYIVKLANYSPDPQDVSITLDGAGSGTLRFIAGNATDANSIEDPLEKRISIQEEVLGVPENGEGRYEFSLPGWAVGVLEVEGDEGE